MGATGWNYFAPYQADIEAALQKLRAEVFERGEYGQAQGMPPEVLASLPPEAREAWEKLRDLEAQRLGGPSREFATIDELLEAAAADGTHSILDILSIGSEPDFGTAWPAPSDVVQRVYGAERPSRAQVEARIGSISEALELERWQAVYVLVYEQGRPVEIYFEGVSGD
ncbi:MAG: hypothetical protein J0M24_22255 [Verrucomicrobia bacterium]|nr:hypothetical protein [Verrucomicrobiota bacterium]